MSDSSTNCPINWKKGVELYEGDQSMLELMIDKFESLYFESSLKKSSEAMKNKNWKALNLEMIVLIGLTNYICAEKIVEKSNRLKEYLENHEAELEESDIKENFLSIMHEAKALKVHLAHRKEMQPDTAEIENIIREFSPNINRQDTDYTTKENFLRADINGARSNPCCACQVF